MSSFINEINKLKVVQQHLEKNECTVIEQFSKYDGDNANVELWKEYDASRTAEKEKIQDDVKNVFVSIHNTKAAISKDNIDNIDFKSLKREMNSIQNSIQQMKTKAETCLEQLCLQEKELSEELKTFEHKVDDWSKPINTAVSDYKLTRASSVMSGNLVAQEVTDFLDFVISNGGHENGWTTADHNLFLRVRNKNKDIKKAAESLHAMLPDISEDEINAHETWYVKYLELKEKQREAIKNWKCKKFVSKTQQENCEQVDKRSSSSSSYLKFQNYDRDEMRDRIVAWRLEKLQKVEDKKEMELEQRLRSQQLEECKRNKNEEAKEAVKNWKHSKIAKVQAEQLDKTIHLIRTRKCRAAHANKLIKEYQKHDNNFIQRMRKLRIVSPKLHTKIKNKHEAPRDPDRLLRPTKQWILRTLKTDKDQTEPMKNNYNVRLIPKLRVPEWRKSIS